VQFLLLHLRISDGLSTQVTGNAQEAIPQWVPEVKGSQESDDFFGFSHLSLILHQNYAATATTAATATRRRRS